MIARLAARQHGVVTRHQLLAHGVSARAIEHRVAIGRLRRVHTGVYAVGHGLSLTGHFCAAVLACGDEAVLSHRSAAAHWGLRPPPGGPIEVTAPRGARRGKKGIRVHATRSLAPAQITVEDGIPCTTPARTLLDLAAVVTPRILERALEQALILRLFDGAAIEAVLARGGGRRGAGILRALVAGMADEPPRVRSEFERRFRALMERAGLPAPVVNGVVAGHEVDFHWSAHRLVVETDGRATHDTALAFERDRARDLDLELAGWHVIRFTWRQIEREPERVVAIVRARLGVGPLP